MAQRNLAKNLSDLNWQMDVPWFGSEYDNIFNKAYCFRGDVYNLYEIF